MKVLLWLMIPVAALILGTIWASIRSRPPRPAAMQDSMASFSRFRRALAASTASSTPKHLAGHDSADAGNLPPDPNDTLEEPGAVGRPL